MDALCYEGISSAFGNKREVCARRWLQEAGEGFSRGLRAQAPNQE